ncbi:hypothetical protein Q4525_00605 [Shimia thalassica]|uniref:hypothetical protein n=1 Tax=Shimia thalassica TaxID=1715693 RepID=UPI001C0A4097|nr:hypothetical protein [Shimia thalassica]MBU2943329.1 hypothetical protein [Shimia thalassica]MDO6501398.1 hypothetical protein [Shimia thalassica]
MRRFFERTQIPNRIKTVTELDPRFRPRWYKLEIRLFQVMVLLVALLVVGAFSGMTWLATLGFYGIGCAFVAVFALEYGSNMLAALGLWLPPLALKAAQLDTWLERDLEWNKW